MSKIALLTGASGFIGSHCIKPLLDRNFEVHALSRNTAIGESAGVIYHQVDLLQEGNFQSLLASIKPTHLLHTAWIVEPGEALTTPLNLLWVERSLGLIRQFRDSGGRRVVVSGTCYEYDTQFGYCVEDQTPLAPVTYYGIAKNTLRALLEKDARSSGYSSAWARLFYLYGPRENRKRLVPSVILSLLQSSDANCSHGTQIRDYLYVQDAADALVTLLDSELSGAYNLCSGQPTTLKDIVNKIAEKLHGGERVKFGALDARSEEVPLIIGDPRKFNNQSGWQPRYDLNKGLDETIQWWREQLKNKKVSND